MTLSSFDGTLLYVLCTAQNGTSEALVPCLKRLYHISFFNQYNAKARASLLGSLSPTSNLSLLLIACRWQAKYNRAHVVHQHPQRWVCFECLICAPSQLIAGARNRSGTSNPATHVFFGCLLPESCLLSGQTLVLCIYPHLPRRSL